MKLILESEGGPRRISLDRNGDVEEDYYVGEDGEYYYDDGDYSDEYSGEEYSDDDAEVVDVSRNGRIGKKNSLLDNAPN